MRLLRLGTLLVVLLAAVTSVSAQAKAPGVTDTEIVIGLTTPLSGPAAAWGNTAVAMEAWAKYVNDQGGIHGRKIKTVLKDDGYVPGRAVANLTEMKDSVFAVVGLLGSAILNASKDLVAEAKIPIVNPYGNPAIWEKQAREKLRYVFVNYPDYIDEGEFLVGQAVTKLGAQKVAVFFQNDDYGKGGLDGVKKGLRGLAGKGSLAAEVAYELADREMGTHALKLKDSGADTVIFYSTITHGANVIKEMAKVGYRPRLVASFPLGDHHIMFRLLGDLWDGAHVNVLGTIVGEPDGDRIADILVKYEPKLKGKESTALAGAAPMILAVEGLKRAGRNLTREAFVEAMETLKDYVPEKLTAPITFGPNRRHGANAVRFMRAEKGNLVPLQSGYQLFPPHF
ncbi:MAG TPA: ABC transporter substrate-binding protein [Methylomirabilota bacterium]|jgi:ABC-type branched-subunit amino acid transport system substrate-binding protein|nr:ABC transporter substrate-binding protein [Methylomirabilota bacterium]